MRKRLLLLLMTSAAIASPEEAAILALAIERAAPFSRDGQHEACAAIYEVAARAVVDLGNLPAAERARLGKALGGGGPAQERSLRLRSAIDAILEATDFEPIMEAPLPEGFPAPGPAGKAVVKDYPAYRAARTPGGMGAFWTLFGHIQRNGIEMTAPVTMTMEARVSGLSMIDMAFLYASPALGEAGKDGAVEVMDLPAIRVLSFGIRGNPAAAVMERAKAEIERLRAEEGMEAAGPLRLLGYNSPMVPAKNRFYELQLPVRAKSRP